MRTKDINSLNQRGYTTVSIDKETKGMIREMAGDMPVSEFVKEMVFEYAEQKQIPMAGSGGTNSIVDKIDRKLQELDKRLTLTLLKAPGTVIDPKPRTPEELEMVLNTLRELHGDQYAKGFEAAAREYMESHISRKNSLPGFEQVIGSDLA